MGDHKLTPRKIQILKAIVDAHISHGEPVGSKFLVEAAGLTCSSATIRNEMADLEEMGYLAQPHTSAGRVPTEFGYRLYVDALIHQYTVTKNEIAEINRELNYKLSEMDAILEEASRLAALNTDYTGIAFRSGATGARVSKFDSVYLGPRDFLLVLSFEGDIVKPKTVHLPFSVGEDMVRRFTELINMYLVNLTVNEITMPTIVRLETLMGPACGIVHPAIKEIYEAMSELDTADVHLDGITKLLQYPEYSDMSKFRGLLGVLEEKDRLVDVISAHSTENDGIHVYIGKEDGEDVMSDTAMIFRNIRIGTSQFAIGVIGPKRMNYSKVIEMIAKLSDDLDKIIAAEVGALPPRHDE